MSIFNRNKAPQKKAMIASYGGVVSGGSPASPDAIMRRSVDWQRRVLHYHDVVPEVHSASAFVYGTSTRVQYVAVGASKVEQLTIDKLLSTFDNGRASQLLFLVGEYYAVFRYDEVIKNVEWDVLSPLEVIVTDNKPVKIRDKKTGKERDLASDEKIFRVWKSDVKDRAHADSAHRSLLDVTEAMYLHQLADTTVATSRLAGAGILYIPDDELPSVPVSDNGKAEPGTREYVEQVIGGSMIASLKNRDVHDALVPVFLFGSSEHAKGLKHLLMERPDDADAYANRMRAYAERYAIGVDLPPEVVTGMGSVTRWTAAKVDQNFWSYYLAPLNQITADALTRNFINEVGVLLPETALVSLQLTADGTNVIQKPDLTEAAVRLKELNVISDEAAARAAGFNPETDLSAEGSQGRESGRMAKMPVSETGNSPAS